jgi:hypothetical protein
LEIADAVKQAYGPLFNLIYVRSDEAGKVIGHFTVYNMVASRIVLAESGATPGQATALVSNPLNPRDWSGAAARLYDVPFDWLSQPKYDVEMARVRFTEVMAPISAPSAPNRWELFGKYGLGPNDQIPPEIREQALGEIFDRIARHMIGAPYEAAITTEELRKALGRPPGDA